MTLPNTHVHLLHSRINGETYSIEVAVPPDYDDSLQRTRRYSTLYLLDGGWELPFVVPMVGVPGVTRQLILVGVERSEGQREKRNRDYTTPQPGDTAYENARAPDGAPRFGGAPLFLRVLQEEVIPLVERTYRTDGDRGIQGHSLGGLFVAYALFEAPDLFSRYAMTSPGLYWNHDMILKREPTFAADHPRFRKDVYVSVGSVEDPGMIRVAWQFVWQLCASHSRGEYQGMDLLAESVAGEVHASVVHEWHAIRALYPSDSTAPKGAGVMQYCSP